MELYWRELKNGFNLVVNDGEGEHKVGGVRVLKKGIQAIAETRGYDPGRAERDLPSVEVAREFVEQFEPWREFFPEPLEVESEIRPIVE
ncbi:MAG: hypothetical protein HQ478_10825 [Chloroflexi bacterium]|nr:hypothetical protein [Chloroflexota bacterium]